MKKLVKVSFPEAICQEFSVSRIHTSYTEKPYYEGQSICSPEIEEIKCMINPVFFDEIIDRMDEVGFYCSGFQKDPKNNKTILWFKPEDL